MAGKLNVDWSLKAKKDLRKIYDNITDQWSEKEAEEFLDLVQEFEKTIKGFPDAFRKSKRLKESRLGFIHKYVTAVYRVYRTRIIIVTVFDNRMRNRYR